MEFLFGVMFVFVVGVAPNGLCKVGLDMKMQVVIDFVSDSQWTVGCSLTVGVG